MNQDATNLSGSLMIRGVLAIFFGAAAVFWPGLTLVTLVYLFSAFILLNGLVDLIFGIGRIAEAGKSLLSRAFNVLFSLFQIGVGVYLLRHPHVTFSTLILLIGFVLIFRGVFEVIAGLFEDSSAIYRVVVILSGIVAVVAGGLVLSQPVASGVAFVWILGVYALITGPMLVAMALDISKAVSAKASSRR
jgi:uncharacterized membrane protein HdeD (DUF308 family)